MVREFPKLKFRGKGHEVTFPFFNNSFSSKLQASDLKYLLKQYELWANRVYPKYTFKDFIRGEIKLFFFFFFSLPPLISFPLSLGLWEKHVEPYQLDNGRLTQENIALHQQIMTLKESLEQWTKDLKASMRCLEHENADLKFLNNQYMQRLIAEKESHAKSEQILELQEKNSQLAIIQTPGGRKRTLPYRRQRMEMDSVLPASSSRSTKKAPRSGSFGARSQLVDILKMAEDKMEELQLALDSVRKEKRELQESVKELKRQVRFK